MIVVAVTAVTAALPGAAHAAWPVDPRGVLSPDLDKATETVEQVPSTSLNAIAEQLTPGDDGGSPPPAAATAPGMPAPPPVTGPRARRPSDPPVGDGPPGTLGSAVGERRAISGRATAPSADDGSVARRSASVPARRSAAGAVARSEARPARLANTPAHEEPEPQIGPLDTVVASVPDAIKAALSFMSVVLVLLLVGVLLSRRQLAQALRRAHSDVVTGLPNRAAVDEALARMSAQAARRGTSLAVAMLDIDHFKAVNDDLGHAMGDQVLAAVGAVARREVRAGDFVGRYGGEELLLLLPETNEDGAHVVAEKLREAIRGIELPGLDRTITASFGVAVGREACERIDDLVEVADEALYRAKDNGRDCIETACGASREFVAV